MTATTTLVPDTDFTGGDSGIADEAFWGLDMTTLTTEADILHCTVEFTRND